MYLLTEKFKRRLIIWIGIVGLSLSMLLIATSPVLHLPHSPYIVFLGLVLLGVSSPLISIPVLPEVLESIETREDLNYSPDQIKNMISSLFVTSTGVGEGIGPVISSLFKEMVGFEHSYELFSCFLLLFSIIYVCYCGGIEIF